MKNKKTIILIIISVLIILTILILLLMQNKTNNISQIEGKTAKATVYTRINEQEIDITNLIEQNQTPKISAGMIPIKWNGTNWVITTKTDNTWFDYTSGKPAYMMLNDGVYQSELIQDMTGKILASDNIGVALDTEDLGSIYAWIPRFAYDSDTNEIIYIKDECYVSRKLHNARYIYIHNSGI